MKKFGKGIGVLIVIISAIGINVIGYKRVKANQHQQRIEQVATTIVSQQKQLTDLQSEIGTVYANDQREFLRANLSSDEIAKMEQSLGQVRSSAEDFGLSVKDLPPEAESISKVKSELQVELQQIATQFECQAEVAGLFTNPLIDWQTVTNDVILAEDVTDEQIERGKQRVQSLDKKQWQKNMQEYISFAQAQMTRIQELEAAFSEMLVEGQITEAATVEAYYNVSESLAMVRNPELKTKFSEQLEMIGHQLGMGSIY